MRLIWFCAKALLAFLSVVGAFDEDERSSIEFPSLLDSDMAADLGIFGADFFADSDSQLTIDLDMFRDIYKELSTYQSSTQEGKTAYLQKVLEFFAPLQEYDVSAPCLADVGHFFHTSYNYALTSIQNRQCDSCNCTRQYNTEFSKHRWIFNVLDSMGKVPAAILGGNNLWTGSWHACRRVSVQKNRQGQQWRGQYCMARFQSYNRHNPLKSFTAPPEDPTAVCFRNLSDSADDWSDDDKQCFDLLPLLNIGVCTPDTCTDHDVRQMLKFIYNSVEASTGKRLVCNVNVQCSNARPENQMWHHKGSIIFSFVLVIILTLLIFGTGYDIYVERPLVEHFTKKAHRHSDSELVTERTDYYRIIEERPKTIFGTTLLVFSVPRNMKYIMDTQTEEGQIRCLHGARFLSMSWVIFGHTYYYICTSLTTDNLLQTMREFPKFFYNQLVVQAPLAVDSFFFLSGLLTAYIFLGKIRKGQVRLDSWATWVAYVARRYIRLTPVYVMVMLLDVTVFPYVSEGPFWRPVEPNFCMGSWWVNLLYVNNFFKQDDACMGWTWYLANDFQFYLFAPLLIILLHRYRWGGVVAGVMAMIASSVITLIITIQKGYPPAPLLTTKLQILAILNDYWQDLYVKPYVRCTPYIIGCLVGYILLEKHKPQFQLSKVKWVFGWICGIMFGMYSVFGLYNFTKTGEISAAYAIAYTVAGRPSFALFMGWLVFACESNRDVKINAIIGHRLFVPLSKITFCAYLIHPLLLQGFYLSRPSAFHFTHSFQLLYMFLIALFASYGAALLLSLAVEVPTMHLDKILFGNGKRRHRPPQSPQQPQPSKNIEEENGVEFVAPKRSSPSSNGEHYTKSNQTEPLVPNRTDS